MANSQKKKKKKDALCGDCSEPACAASREKKREGGLKSQ